MFIAPGFTFMDNVVANLSSTGLAAFMASANVTAIAISELRATSKVVLVAATTPIGDQGEGSLWFDTTLNILRVLNGTRWDCPYIGPEMQNNSGNVIQSASWVVASGDNTFSMSSTQAWPEVLGVSLSNVANGSKGIIARTGIGRVKCRGPLSYGDVLVGASIAQGFGAAGYAVGATLVYGFTTFTAGIEIGMALGALANTTGLVTCMIWR